MADDESLNNDEELSLCNLLEQQQITTQHSEDTEFVLASFRQEWRRELENANSRRGSNASPSQLSPYMSSTAGKIKSGGHEFVEAKQEVTTAGQNYNKVPQSFKLPPRSNTTPVTDQGSVSTSSNSSSVTTASLGQNNKTRIDDAQDAEKKATEFFNKATDLERTGRLYEAIQFYRRAMVLVPDIEFRVRRNLETPEAQRTQTDSDELNNNGGNNNNNNGDDGYSDGIEEDFDLITKFKSLMTSSHPVCVPQYSQEAAHISCLPPEMIDKILHWIVGEDLDLRSLEKTAAVCRGFYLLARSSELWKKISNKIWGCNISSYHPYLSFRDMVLLREHPRFDGCYISCTTYYQPSESSFQDLNYQPWHVVKYYRLVRFFSDGDVVMLTTSDEPQQVVQALRGKDYKLPQVMVGHYYLKDDKVSLEFSRISKKAIRNRHKPRRYGGTTDVMETRFNIEFSITSVSNKPNWKLNWTHYSITSQYYDHRKNTSNLEVTNSDNFPTLYFSRVRSYCTETTSPLN